MEIIECKDAAEQELIAIERGTDEHVIRHINVDGSRELRITRKPPASLEEKIMALESRVAAMEQAG